jgi:hypothetical protein
MFSGHDTPPHLLRILVLPTMLGQLADVEA